MKRKIVVSRIIEVDAEIADEIEWLNQRGVITESSCSGHGNIPPSAFICPSSIRRAKMLGYMPEYQEDTGLFEMELKSRQDEKNGELQRFGWAIQSARKKKGWSQEELAARAGISRSYVCQIERGKVDLSWRIATRLLSQLNLNTASAWPELTLVVSTIDKNSDR